MIVVVDGAAHNVWLNALYIFEATVRGTMAV